MRCTHGHTIPLGQKRCPECNRQAVRRNRAKVLERTAAIRYNEGPIWQLLRAGGYLDRKQPTTRNSLGLWYRGP